MKGGPIAAHLMALHALCAALARALVTACARPSARPDLLTLRLLPGVNLRHETCGDKYKMRHVVTNIN